MKPLFEMIYPEHEKLSEIQHFSQCIGEFIDWLKDDKGVVLAKYGDDGLKPTLFNHDKYLCEFFNIYLIELEQEKMAILELLTGMIDEEA